MSIFRARTAHDPGALGLPLAAGLLLFVPLALFGNEIGSVLQYPDVGAAVLFPPYAALTAALLVAPRRHWFWYILAGSIAHFTTHWPHWTLSWVLFADAANIARALTAAATLRWLFGGPPRLDSLGALAIFVMSAALLAPAVGATIGAANVVFHGASETYWRPWSAWFVSNALTGLAMLPALVAAFAFVAEGRRLPIERRRIGEALLLSAALGATCAAAFLFGGPDRRHLVLMLYAPLPVLMWAALRFGSAGASLALTAVALLAIWSVDRDTAPLLALPTDDNIITIQVFVLLTTVPVLCLAVVGRARQAVAQLYRALLASMEDHVASLDARGVVLEVNDSWRRFADSTDLPLFHRVHPGADYLATCRAAAEGGDAIAARILDGVSDMLNRAPRRFQIEYDDARDGRLDSYVLSVEALERSDGGAVVTRANVTARRRAQLEIEEQRRELSHLARVAVLGQLSGALAHELRQPLTSILSNAEAARHLLHRGSADVEELSAILRDIIAEDKRASEVIHRLRALLKRGDARLQPVDTSELIADVLELAHAELITRRVTANAVVETGLSPLLGDKVQLQQVLLNLILNGCEAMATIAVFDRRLFVTAAADRDGSVHLAVRDRGPGIEPGPIDRLFEPFVTTKPEGLGLGLSIARTIVAAHGGRLWAENNPDGGATIHCLLAVTERSPASAERQGAEAIRA
jgi:two-component system sensor kinase FixL